FSENIHAGHGRRSNLGISASCNGRIRAISSNFLSSKTLASDIVIFEAPPIFCCLVSRRTGSTRRYSSWRIGRFWQRSCSRASLTDSLRETPSGAERSTAIVTTSFRFHFLQSDKRWSSNLAHLSSWEKATGALERAQDAKASQDLAAWDHANCDRAKD